MNPAIQALILQIVTTALQINAQGKWRASIDLAAFNDQSVHLSLYPADTDFEQPVKQWPSANHRGVALGLPCDEHASERLQELICWLRDFLQVDAEEAAA